MRCSWGDFMNVEIKEEKDNPFFERKELRLLIKHPKLATPSKAELIKELAAEQKCDADCILIDFILTKKGLNESEAKVKIYKNKAKIPKTKVVEKKVEEKPKEEKKSEEAKAEVGEEKKLKKKKEAVPEKGEGKDEAQTSQAK